MIIFMKKKLETIVNYFKNNDKAEIVFDLPINVYENSNYIEKGNKYFFKTYWPFIHPTSCITIKKKFLINYLHQYHLKILQMYGWI